MKPADLYRLMRGFWPMVMDRLPPEDFAVSWGPALGKVPDVAGLKAIATLGETSKWCPSLAEFLIEARRAAGVSPATQSEAYYDCLGKPAGCVARLRGYTAITHHETTCREAARQREANAAAADLARSKVGDVLAGLRKGTA